MLSEQMCPETHFQYEFSILGYNGARTVSIWIQQFHFGRKKNIFGIIFIPLKVQ